MIFQWTSPDVKCELEGINLTGCSVWVSLQQGKTVELDVHDNVTVTYDATNNITTVVAPLEQAQTAKLKKGTVELQVNWVTPEGRRDATFIRKEEVYVNLLEREVSYDE